MSKIHEIYSYEDYRLYLERVLAQKPFGRGARGTLARYLDCQSSFISQVFSEKSNFSLEHAFQINQFLRHGRDESHYFLTMVQLARAGSYELESHFRQLLVELRADKMQVGEVIESRSLQETDILSYYGNWLCVAIHMLVAIPQYQSIVKMKEKLKAGDVEFDEALHFLERTGLVKRAGDRLYTGEARIHLQRTSPYAQAASVLTRQKMIEKIKLKDPHSLNYTVNFTIPHSAYAEIKARMLELVQDIEKLMDSGESETYCTIVMDLVEH